MPKLVTSVNDAPIGSHVVMTYRKAELIGEVRGHYPAHGKGYPMLAVHFFNGEPWPVTPVVGADIIQVLERSYEDE